MNEYELPIDIHTNKLLDWLISRKHCTKNWKAELDKIREKIRSAIKDMPENGEIEKILSKHQFNYFICKKIIEILKETEKHSKNLFGYYSSQRMKDWQDIIQMYEKDGIYLAELASILIRNVTYEVPSLKKTINRMQQLHEEYNRKQAEYLKQSTSLKKEYNQMAESHGLKGADIEEDLELLFEEIPKILNNLQEKISYIKPIKELYLAFINKINQQEIENYLILLNYLLIKGNTTYFEYVNGFKPVEIRQEKIDLKSRIKKITEEKKDKIDFAVENKEIDFGDENQIDFGDENQIDFGDENQIDFGDENNEIDFGDKESLSNSNNEDKNIAKGKDALTILEHFKTRNLILNELYEIEAFLQQRLIESKSYESNFITIQLEESPEIVGLFDVDFLESKLSIVQHTISLFNQDKIKMLCLLKDNEKYLDTILHKFNHKNLLVQRAIKKAEEMRLSADSCIYKIELIKRQIPVLIDATKEIQNLVQNAISGFYKNRPVNIMGMVNIM